MALLNNEDELLASCYGRALEIATEKGLRTVAFPAISTGVYRFPVGRAARIAVGTVKAYLDEHRDTERVVFSCFGRASVGVHEAALTKWT